MINYYDKIKIIGDKKFILQTKKALSLIKNKSSVDFEKVEKWIKSVKSDNISRIILKKAQFAVGEKTAYSELEWYASTFVHEATHQYLHSTKLLIWKSGNFYKHEKLCIDEQIRFLKSIKAKKQIINWCEGSLNRKHWNKSSIKKQSY